MPKNSATSKKGKAPAVRRSARQSQKAGTSTESASQVTTRGKSSVVTSSKKSAKRRTSDKLGNKVQAKRKKSQTATRGKRSVAPSKAAKRPRLQEQVTESDTPNDSTSEDENYASSELNASVFPSDLDMLSDDELPRECPLPASGSVTAHLDDRVLQKIIQGRYIQLSTLLPNNKTTTKLVFNSQSGSLATMSNSKKLFNFSEWLDAFLIYATIRGGAHASEAVHMYKYIQTIKRIKDRGGNFVRYDESFRAKYKGLAVIPWHTVDTEEMLWSCNDPSYVPFEKFMKNKESIKHSTSRRTYRSMGTKAKCFYFNKGQHCDKKRCNYLHECKVCGGSHPATACTQQSGAKQINNNKQ